MFHMWLQLEQLLNQVAGHSLLLEVVHCSTSVVDHCRQVNANQMFLKQVVERLYLDAVFYSRKQWFDDTVAHCGTSHRLQQKLDQNCAFSVFQKDIRLSREQRGFCHLRECCNTRVICGLQITPAVRQVVIKSLKHLAKTVFVFG